MSKKEKSKKNVFGLVSKLGNLIKGNSSSNNSDTSSGENEIPQKNFNVHISEDNQEQIELGDEEEEEEEEEENTPEEKKESKEIKNNSDEKNENKNNNENKNIDIDIDNKNIADDIKKEKLNEKKEENKIDENKNQEINDNKKNKEIKEDNKKEETKEENNINNNTEKIEQKNNIIKEEKNEKLKEINNRIEENNININNDINKEKIKEEKNTNENEISSNITEENIKEEDINESCHLYLKKGNDFNYKDMHCFYVSKIKIKKKKSLFQKMNLFKKAKNEIINYIIFFEDNFIYLANDIIINKNNDELRRINKIYNIRDILNYTNNKDAENKKYKIIFEIMNKKQIKKNKEYLIEEQYFEEFNNEIIKKLALYGDKLIKNEN